MIKFKSIDARFTPDKILYHNVINSARFRTNEALC